MPVACVLSINFFWFTGAGFGDDFLPIPGGDRAIRKKIYIELINKKSGLLSPLVLQCGLTDSTTDPI